ncbi:HAD-IIB family hydrolase [Vibrio sp. SCSIO 43136]|uniref:HAD-IIB family hydrolase n=1 Tax=Vibrio sp. SCSIO 43136 TaxID=2819101 RepID=UPI002075E124|nr:HAD-IIB family hydrolase [Vibrio sp. SCSIO 43136]USD67302.1 HAD-IIB family hydrolase [Vibrio sp. SCSIO 43136]
MIKMLVCDFDGTIHGGGDADVSHLYQAMQVAPDIRFVVSTGRTFSSIQRGLSEHDYPTASSIISDVGTQVFHCGSHSVDLDWQNRLRMWDREQTLDVLATLGFLGKQVAQHQSDYKVTYEGQLTLEQVSKLQALIEEQSLAVDMTYSHDWFLDITPAGINKASALEHLMALYELAPNQVVVAGDSANDTAMLTMQGINAVLVANHFPEVKHLVENENVYLAKASHAQGVVEGLRYWQKRYPD